MISTFAAFGSIRIHILPSRNNAARIRNNVPVKATSYKMDHRTEETKEFTVYEWTIENFSYFNREFHNLHLKTVHRSNMVQFEIFAGIGSCRPDGMRVIINNIPGNVKGDFSLICPDGSIVWTKRVDKLDDDDGLYIGDMPLHFSDLVALIRRNEAVHGDRLTLRFRFDENRGRRNVFHSMHSMFEVRTMSMKINLSSILSSQPQFDHSRVITAEYFLHDGSTERVRLRINETPSSKIELILDPGLDSSVDAVVFRAKMSLLHNDGTLIRTENHEDCVLNKGEVWTFSDSLTKNEVLEGLSVLLKVIVLPSKTLTHLYTLSSPFVAEVATDRAILKEPEERAVAVLLKDFLCLHQNRDFSDLQLQCEGVAFPVHKSILSARSPVFKSMLSSDMKESASGSVDIVDIDSPTLARFLAFLYSGTVNDMQTESALKLYYAADKYQVPSLKTACASFLSYNLSIASVCDVLSLADKHRDEHLVSAAHSLILKHFNQVLGSEEWGNLMRKDPVLALKTVTDFVRKRYVISAEAAKNNS